MSNETDYLLRLMSQATKEVKAVSIEITSTATKLTSQLTTGYTRKGLFAYNSSDAASGECYWGMSDVTINTGQVIPKGAQVDIPVSTDLDVYFICESGELGDLRTLEIA
jgi:hypothetical protein